MVVVLGLGAYACSKGGGNGGNDSPTSPSVVNPGVGEGTLTVKLTDKPSVDFQKIFLTIERVRIHQSGAAGDGAAGWVDLPVTMAMPVDLLTLQNGVTKDLTGTALAAGSYQQIRLQLTPNTGGAAPYANSVVLADGSEYPLEVPGGSVKIVHGVTVVDGQATEVVIDLDAKLSVKQRGNGTYFMQPVIKATTK
jgi:hypothetical protein